MVRKLPRREAHLHVRRERRTPLGRRAQALICDGGDDAEHARVDPLWRGGSDRLLERRVAPGREARGDDRLCHATRC